MSASREDQDGYWSQKSQPNVIYTAVGSFQLNTANRDSLYYTMWAIKKRDTFIISITQTNIDRFSYFFTTVYNKELLRNKNLLKFPPTLNLLPHYLAKVEWFLVAFRKYSQSSREIAKILMFLSHQTIFGGGVSNFWTKFYKFWITIERIHVATFGLMRSRKGVMHMSQKYYITFFRFYRATLCVARSLRS